MEVDLIERSPTRIVALRYVGPPGPPLARYWQSRVNPWIEARGLSGRAMIVIGHDNPTVTAPDKCRCDCRRGGRRRLHRDRRRAPRHRSGRPLREGALLHTPSRIEAAWTSLMCDWLPASGLQLDGRPTFEHYPKDARYDDARGAFECRLMVPIVPL